MQNFFDNETQKCVIIKIDNEFKNTYTVLSSKILSLYCSYLNRNLLKLY